MMPVRCGGIVFACLIVLPGFAARAQTDSFQTLMDASMMRMHAAMMLPGMGDVDRDFAAMMIPHHQGAVEMAEAELRFGKDERLRRLAQGIIVEQRQEIAVMRQILETLPSGTLRSPALPLATLPPAGAQPTIDHDQTHPDKDR